MANIKYTVPQGIGDNFATELTAARISSGVSWSVDDSSVRVSSSKARAYHTAVQAVITAHDPATPGPAREGAIMSARIAAALAKGTLDRIEARSLLSDVDLLVKDI